MQSSRDGGSRASRGPRSGPSRLPASVRDSRARSASGAWQVDHAFERRYREPSWKADSDPVQLSPAGHSIGSHSSAAGSLRLSSSCAGRTRQRANRELNGILLPSRQVIVLPVIGVKFQSQRLGRPGATAGGSAAVGLPRRGGNGASPGRQTVVVGAPRRSPQVRSAWPAACCRCHRPGPSVPRPAAHRRPMPGASAARRSPAWSGISPPGTPALARCTGSSAHSFGRYSW